MIPDVDPSSIEHGSERPVYEALRDQLSDEFSVLHSYPWLRRAGKAKALEEGEADFVVLHRQLGLLVLEVKGGKEIWYENRQWFRQSAEGPRPIKKDPFLQAQRSVRELVAFVEKRSRGELKEGDYVFGHAVVFPQMDFDGPLPHHADRATLISQRGARQMESAIRGVFRAWARSPARELSGGRFKTLLHALLPKFNLARRVGPEVDDTNKGLMELTAEQAEMVEGLYQNGRVLVKGVAGSGKTSLAMIRAVALAREGKRTLFVCYNKALARWLQRQVRNDPENAGCLSQLTIHNFHGLAKDLATEAGLEFNPPLDRRSSAPFWESEAPILLEEAVERNKSWGNDIRFDALVVDEAQDFLELWWDVLIKSVLRDQASPIYAFMDPNQALWGRLDEPSIPSAVSYELPWNCRNTRLIAATAAHVMHLKPKTHRRAPRGDQIGLCQPSGALDQEQRVVDHLSRLIGKEGLKPQQVAVIGPRAWRKGGLKDVVAIKGVPLTGDPEVWLDGRGLLVTTSRSFKGLEADVIVLYDLAEIGETFRLEDLYVACTRAKARLNAFAHGTECAQILQEARNSAQIHA